MAPDGFFLTVGEGEPAGAGVEEAAEVRLPAIPKCRLPVAEYT
jgi:hypothetical protein